MQPSLQPVFRGRRFAMDNMFTYDGMAPVMDQSPLWKVQRPLPVMPGAPLGLGASGARGGVLTHDGFMRDSTGSFLVGELERLDPKMHEPLAAVSWGRDIDIREDLTIADDVSSFTLTTFAAQGGLGQGNGIGNGKSWADKSSDQIVGINVDISKIANPMFVWAKELKYSIPEIESSAKVGRPIDQQKFAGLQLKYQMDVDEEVYIGDTGLQIKGLLNNALVTAAAVANGASGSPLWTQKTPDEILTDFNTALTTVWKNSGFAIIPADIGLPTSAYGYIATQKVSLAGNESILSYIERNNLFSREGKGNLKIKPMKFCNGSGAGGTIGTGGAGFDRMIVYTKDKDRVRFPMTMLQRTPLQYDGLYHKCTYFGRLGVVEWVYPETGGYFDGIS
jgi:hypothetical protein